MICSSANWRTIAMMSRCSSVYSLKGVAVAAIVSWRLRGFSHGGAAGRYVPPMRTSRAVILVVSSLGLFLSACGDDKKSGDNGARGYAETGKAVDKACLASNAKLAPLVKQLTGNAKHDAPILEKVAQEGKDYEQQLEQITPDAKLKSTLVAYEKGVEAKIEEFGALTDAATRADDAPYKPARDKVGAENTSLKPLERALGADACA